MFCNETVLICFFAGERIAEGCLGLQKDKRQIRCTLTGGPGIGVPGIVVVPGAGTCTRYTRQSEREDAG